MNRAADRGLDGMRVLITGGGAGIGAATARTIIAAGGRVALMDRDGEAVRSTAAALGGNRTLAVVADVVEDDAAGRAFDAMADLWGGADALINNAGAYDHAPLLDLTADRWRAVLAVNLLAPIAISNEFVRRLAGPGAVVNVASVLGQVIAPGRGPYCLSKAALITLTRQQAVEWAPRGVRVNAIAPGYIENEAIRRFEAEGGFDRGAVTRRTPMGRLGDEAEIAAGICFLLDPARAGYITGHVLEVSGGWTAYGYV